MPGALRLARWHLVAALVTDPEHPIWAALADKLNDSHLCTSTAWADLGLPCVTVRTNRELRGACTHGELLWG